jgi:hypothetical protein
MTPTGYLVQALIYSIVGFAAGYGVCWVTRRAAEGDGAGPGRGGEWWRAPLGLLLLVLVAYTTITTTRFNTCQRDTNNQFRSQLAQRGGAQTEWIEAQEQFLDVTANPAADMAAKQAAYRRYRDALTQLKAVQAANPLRVRDCS